jgi:hypothetical protein
MEAAAAKDAALRAEDNASKAGVVAATYSMGLGEASAKYEAAVAALTDLQTKLADTSLELTMATQTNAERAEALLKLEAELQAARTAAYRELERAKAALVEAETRAATVEGQLAVARDEAAARLASVLGSHRALIADAVGRMARRQAEKARRYQATPEKLRRWLETFAAVEAPICVEALLPAVRTHLAWMQSAEDPAFVTQTLVKAHLDTFEIRLLSAADAEPDEFHATLEAVLQRWEADRPTEVADAILQEGIAYVRAR